MAKEPQPLNQLFWMSGVYITELGQLQFHRAQ